MSIPKTKKKQAVIFMRSSFFCLELNSDGGKMFEYMSWFIRKYKTLPKDIKE